MPNQEQRLPSAGGSYLVEKPGAEPKLVERTAPELVVSALLMPSEYLVTDEKPSEKSK